MQRPRARPRFTLELPLAPEVITERVRTQLATEGQKVTGSVFRRTLLLTLRKEDTHFWTPHLDVHDERKEGGTRLSAVFSPHPQVWTSFVAVQLLFALLSVAAGIWVTSMLMLGRDPLVSIAALALMLFGGGFAYVGQGIGSEQMYELRAFLDGALREP
jgi:hypothetical protein